MQKITRENLKEIHKVACIGWQSTLSEYAKRNVFSNEIELTNYEVTKMFEASNAEQKAVLSRYLTSPKSIIDRVKSFEDACEVLQIKIDLTKYDDKKYIAYVKLTTIIKALNDGWCPNWNNSNEYKYYPYFDMRGGFSYNAVTYCYYSVTCVASALYLKNKDLAEHCARIAFNEYKEFYTL